MLFGARTGRDGIGGASVLASAELGDEDSAKRPTVQIGDPFEESKLLECSLELLEAGLLVALQDLGAAGLTSSASEMAAKGGVGIDLDVRRVPLREADMEPFEIMISESQERMLCVVEPERLDAVLAVCAQVGGQRDRDRRGHRLRPPAGLRRRGAGRRPAGRARWSTSARRTTSSRRSAATPIYPPPARVLDQATSDAARRCWRCSAAPTSPRAGGRSSSTTAWSARAPCGGPEQADAAVLMLDGGGAIAVSIDGNGRRVAIDPYRGAVEAVLECAANLACVGAEPLGLTNCLNFGNPEKPHIAWQLTRAVAGLGDACRALGVPGRGRQRVAVQRGRRRSDLPDAGRRHGRRAARPGALRSPAGSPRRATPSR